MARTRIALALFAASVALPGWCADLAVLDPEGTFVRAGLALSAEKVRHRDRDYLLLRITSTGQRLADRGNGADVHAVVEQGPGLAFLPVTVACDRMELQLGGRTLRPDRTSTCLEPTRLARIGSMPLFVAFALDSRAAVQMAAVRVPVVVTRPDPPVQRALREDPEPALYRPRVEEMMLGERTLSASIEVR